MKTKHLIISIITCSLLFQPLFLTKSENFQVELHEQHNSINIRSSFSANSSDYTFFWDEMQNLPGQLSGDDILHYGSSFGPFHNYSEFSSKLFLANQTFPEIVDLFSIGKTFFGREIWCAKLTNEKELSNKTQILIVAQHHAREQITVENALYVLDRILFDFTQGNEKVIEILTEKEIYIIPSLNIDGAQVIHQNPWQRKTARPIDEDGDGIHDEWNGTHTVIEAQDTNNDYYIDSYRPLNNPDSIYIGFEGLDLDNDSKIGEESPGGVDPNRNYDYDFANPRFTSNDPRSQIYHGGNAFSENCTLALRDFVSSNKFTVSISLHSGIKMIYYPLITANNAKGQTRMGDLSENEFYQKILKEMLGLSGYQAEYSPYPGGMFTPWIYFTQKTTQIAICFETYGNRTATDGEVNYTTNEMRVWGIWDLFNPPANEIIENSQDVYKGIFHLMETQYYEKKENSKKITGYSGIFSIYLIGLLFLIYNSQKRRFQSSE